MFSTQISPWLSWQQLGLRSRELLPNPALQSWLLESGSLTQRLRQSLDAPLQLRVESADWESMEPQFALAMGLRTGLTTWVRRVALGDSQQIWFRARTYIPVTSLVGEVRRLRRWGNRSLGDFLFAQANPQRSSLSFALFREDGERVWGRRCCHYLYNRPIMVCEFFAESSPCASNW